MIYSCSFACSCPRTALLFRCSDNRIHLLLSHLVVAHVDSSALAACLRDSSTRLWVCSQKRHLHGPSSRSRSRPLPTRRPCIRRTSIVSTNLSTRMRKPVCRRPRLSRPSGARPTSSLHTSCQYFPLAVLPGLLIARDSIWLFYVVTSIQEVALRVYTPFVTSAFQQHSLTAATDIMAYLIAGLVKLPLAKILDTWGRPQGLSLMLLFWTIGFIAMAGCNSVTTFAAAQVFYAVGYLLSAASS